MSITKWFLPALVLTALAAGSIGFGASYLRDTSAIETLRADRDMARDCRRSGANVRPCPVLYRNTRIVWQDRIRTIKTPDRKQAARIGFLSTQLARARRTIHRLESWESRVREPRATGAYALQNGSMGHPYNTSERCPSGAVVVYDAGLSAGSNALRRSGNPDVCYVRTQLSNSRLALLSSRH